MPEQLTFDTHRPTYKIVFDGGSLGNPGKGYGSYLITGPGVTAGIVALDFSANGEVVSNNQAEYRTLIEAITKLPDLVGRPASELAVQIFGDSKLVIEQLSGRWKVKHPDMKIWHAQARDLLTRFGSYKLTWHPREESVKTLGH